jgi:hypothetical protein
MHENYTKWVLRSLFWIDRSKSNRQQKLFSEKLFELEILRTDDSEEIAYFTSIFYDLLSLFTKPFQTFDSPTQFLKVAKLGERFASDTNLENEWKMWF